jgi:dolichyl-phosphate-mannose--protein O-mannosyl transferase
MVPESSSVPFARIVLTAAIIFIVAHLVFLIGLTAPEKFYFDEVHYVPAARQMLEPLLRAPMLNPMHPSWPFLVRPVWYLFDKLDGDRIAAVVLLGNPLILLPALVALAVTLRDWIVARRSDAFPVLAFYFGPYLAWALLPRTLGFIYYYLPAATTASYALVYALTRGRTPRCLLWAFVAIGALGFAAMLPISAAFIGTSVATFQRLMLFHNWI